MHIWKDCGVRADIPAYIRRSRFSRSIMAVTLSTLALEPMIPAIPHMTAV